MNKEERLKFDGATEDPVLFYADTDYFGCFSNFSGHEVMLPSLWRAQRSVTYRTGEHAFQARKMATEDEHDVVVVQPSAFMAKKYGGPGFGTMRTGWGDRYGDLCYYVMLEIVTAKAMQHDDVFEALKETGQALIYEDSPVDDIWGWRHRNDYRGKNLLGISWMQAREALLGVPLYLFGG